MKSLEKISLTILTLVLLFIVAPAAKAQHPAVKDYYSHYEHDSQAHHIVLEGGVFKILSWFASLDENDKETQAFSRITDNIEGLDLVIIPKNIEKAYTFRHVKSQVEKDNFKELLNIRDKGSLVNIYAQGNDNEVRDMIIFVDDETEYCIISLRGVLSMEDLQYLATHHKELKNK